MQNNKCSVNFWVGTYRLPFHARLSTWSLITFCPLVTSFTWNSRLTRQPLFTLWTKKKKKGNLDFRTYKHIIFKWILNSGPSSSIVQGSGEVKICMIILPTNILHIHNIWLQWTRNVAVGDREFQRLWSWLWKEEERGGLQVWEQDTGATERVWYVRGCLYVMELVFYLNGNYFAVFSLPYKDDSADTTNRAKSLEMWTLVLPYYFFQFHH